jgi:hypothetical protein
LKETEKLQMQREKNCVCSDGRNRKQNNSRKIEMIAPPIGQ